MTMFSNFYIFVEQTKTLVEIDGKEDHVEAVVLSCRYDYPLP